jgi:hypothetical protein
MSGAVSLIEVPGVIKCDRIKNNFFFWLVEINQKSLGL